MFKNDKTTRICITLVWICCLLSLGSGDLLRYNKQILEDANLLVVSEEVKSHRSELIHMKFQPDLIKKYGYPVETHKIQAKDGFVLTAFRIPKPGGQPVLLVHGLGDSCAGYVIRGPNRSLAFLLSDQGYDVWLLNTRGNRYSRKHKRFHRYQPQFWDFSFHELGAYDLPAAIDHVLARSKGFEQVHYVGHSQGTTSFFAMGSERPSYMKKVKLMQALAPVAFFYNIQSPIVVTLAKHTPLLANLARTFGIHEVPPENEVWRRLSYQICSFAFRNTCDYLILEIMGVDYQQFNTSLVPLFLGHTPSGTSLKSLEHYAQLARSGGFYKFNYQNAWENRRRHGSDTAPQYNLTEVDCKVALHYGKNDRLTAVKDVLRLREILPNVVYDNLIDNEAFNHIDFLWANDVKALLYDDMIELMQKVDRGEL
ncbi:hypothetical protein KR018_000331 [Drosophila ironensis]|nr:hypothetical protein KR018_000331 [Drosophila ironensis]